MAALTATAQAPSHTDVPGTEALVTRSAFAHGFAHGYEEGYHHANIAMHMAHKRRDALDALSDAKLRTVYTKEYGNRKNFLMGFRDGFVAGYNDVYDGSKYRAVEALRQSCDGLEVSTRSRTFDEGFMAGLVEVRKEPSAYAWNAHSLPTVVQNCRSSGLSGEYCEGFARGIRFGTLEPSPQVRAQTASK